MYIKLLKLCVVSTTNLEKQTAATKINMFSLYLICLYQFSFYWQFVFEITFVRL